MTKRATSFRMQPFLHVPTSVGNVLQTCRKHTQSSHFVNLWVFDRSQICPGVYSPRSIYPNKYLPALKVPEVTSAPTAATMRPVYAPACSQFRKQKTTTSTVRGFPKSCRTFRTGSFNPRKMSPSATIKPFSTIIERLDLRAQFLVTEIPARNLGNLLHKVSNHTLQIVPVVVMHRLDRTDQIQKRLRIL